jgi:YVTN family beta-propeller protein
MSDWRAREGISSKRPAIFFPALAAIVYISAFALYCLCVGQAYALADMVPVAYTANTASNTVSVIDMRDDTIFATVYDVSSPTGLAISPDNKWLYVTNGEINNVTYISMSSYRITGTIPVGRAPYGIAMTPDGGTAYVTNYLDNTASIINVTNKKVNGTINVGNGPYGIEINPVNGEAYVVNSDDGTISVIRDKSIFATIAAGGHAAKGLAVTPDGSRLLVLDKDNNRVSIINTTTYEVINTVNTGRDPAGIAISPDGWYAFITNAGSRNISDLQLSDNTIRVSFSMDDPSLIAFRPDGRMVYVITTPTGHIQAMDSATGEIKATIGVCAADIEVAMVSGSMMVDTTPPETRLALYGETDASGAYIGEVICNITAVDYPAGTELDNCEYSFDGIRWVPYADNFTLSTPVRTIVYYRSIDKYGNEEWPRSKVIYIVAGASSPDSCPVPSPTMPPANASIWTGPTEPAQGASPVSSGTPQPTEGFDVTLAAMGLLCAIYLIIKKK